MVLTHQMPLRFLPPSLFPIFTIEHFAAQFPFSANKKPHSPLSPSLSSTSTASISLNPHQKSLAPAYVLYRFNTKRESREVSKPYESQSRSKVLETAPAVAMRGVLRMLIGDSIINADPLVPMVISPHTVIEHIPSFLDELR